MDKIRYTTNNITIPRLNNAFWSGTILNTDIETPSEIRIFGDSHINSIPLRYSEEINPRIRESIDTQLRQPDNHEQHIQAHERSLPPDLCEGVTYSNGVYSFNYGKYIVKFSDGTYKQEIISCNDILIDYHNNTVAKIIKLPYEISYRYESGETFPHIYTFNFQGFYKDLSDGSESYKYIGTVNSCTHLIEFEFIS